MSEIKVGAKKAAREKVIIISPENAVLKTIINIIGTAIIGAVAYYFLLPALNFKAIEFYIFIAIICAGYGIMAVITSKAVSRPEYMPYVTRRQMIPSFVILIIAAVFLLGGLVVSSVFFRAKSYSKLLPVENGNFSQDIKETDFSKIPQLDETSAATLAKRKLGDLIDYVSQYEVDEYYTQINYKNEPVRVTPLRYAGIIKWIANTNKGIPAYIIINMATQKTELVELKSNMKYSTAEHFNKRLSRHLRFEYPTYMFDDACFEIDENKNPYWICPRIDKTIGLLGGTDVIGAAVVNAVTGECKYYSVEQLKTDKSLQWIDRVYSPDLIVDQYDYSGQYSKGFWNSLLAQRDVKVTTEEHSFLALNDDVYLYTGVTSVTSDQSIVGFVLVNERTKEAKFYKIGGAKEYSAMESAQGQVQDLGYTATFPLLLNVGNQPTYFMTLKDKDNLVKMYAMVNVNRYNIVKTASTLEECRKAYVNAMNSELHTNINVDEPQNEENNTDVSTVIKGKVTDIRTAVIGGESYYFIKVDSSSSYYKLSAKGNEDVVILNNDTEVVINLEKAGNGSIVEAKSIEIK